MRRYEVWAAWGTVAGGLCLCALVFVVNRGRFDYAFEMKDIPAMALAVGLVVCGLLVLPLPSMIERAGRLLCGLEMRRLLAFVVIVGFGLRALLFVTEPALEDDYYRYMWDGAVTAHGFNPYAQPPADALADGEETALGRLAAEGVVVMERINHADLKTIYPPVAQAAFALSHWLAPWRINGWRLVCLAGEAATLALLLALLRASDRNPLWAALYWWNPLIIKETINSAHMEAILMPLVLAAVLLAVRRKPVASVAMLGLAAGAKLWPILLAPLLLRPLFERPARLVAASAMLALMMLLWLLPIWLGGIDETSGFVAFANYWQTNSAIFLIAAKVADVATTALGLSWEVSGRIARAGLGLAVGAVAVGFAWRPWTNALELLQKVALVTAALFLLSPAQFPWYAAWMLPFLAFRPSYALLALTALLPVYYASFHFLARGQYDTFRYGLVWLIWLPVWAGIVAEWWMMRRRQAGHA